MKFKNSFFSSALALFFLGLGIQVAHAGPADAWHHHGHHQKCWGPYTDSTLLSETATPSGDCRLAEPLTLSRGDHLYPLMAGGTTLTVDYWTGSYSRTFAVADTYELDTHDCWGHLLDSSTTTSSSVETRSFVFDNPNLHDDVTASFVANAPMTDDEAKAALEGAKISCETAN